MNDKQLHEMIDACRPGDDDLNQPEMAVLASHLAQNAQASELRQRIEQTDCRIIEAFQEVSVPSGLAERLLAGCDLAASCDLATSQGANGGLEASAVDAVKSVGNIEIVRRSGRRRFFALSMILSTAAAIALVAVSFWGPDEKSLAADEVLRLAMHFFIEQDSQPGVGQPLETAPAEFPAAEQEIYLPEATKWRQLKSLAGEGSMIAYDLTAPRARVRATLYVLRTSVTGLPNAVPNVPLKATRGCCLSAWKVGDLVYVLAVHGQESDYQAFLKSNGSQLASARLF